MTNPILKDGERIDQLFSTDVKIIQNKEVFSYSIDSVLLSRFPKIPKKGLIVDLCSGNGAVGLFASTRTEAPITLVELQERLADMAKRSVTLNQLEDQVTVVNDDLKNLLDHAPRSQVDLILCNPPYFKATETSKKNLSEHYLLARHEITTNLEEICQVARHALKSNGRIAMVHRPDRFLDIIDTMRHARNQELMSLATDLGFSIRKSFRLSLCIRKMATIPTKSLRFTLEKRLRVSPRR